MIENGRATTDDVAAAEACSNRWERLCSGLLWKSADALLTAPLRPRRGLGAHLGSFFGLSTSRYDRVGEFLCCADRVLPGTARRCSRLLLRTRRLPFSIPLGDPEQLGLVGYGSGGTVFRLGDAPDAPVLKIFRRSLGRDRGCLEEQLRLVRRRYREARSWFEEAPELVLPTSYLILPAPLLGLPSVGAVQPFVGGTRRDLLAEHDDAQLLEILTRDAGLGLSFSRFAHGALAAYDRDGRCLDLLGRDNLLLVTGSGTARLVLLDFGIFQADGNAHDRERVERMQPLLARLRSLLERLP